MIMIITLFFLSIQKTKFFLISDFRTFVVCESTNRKGVKEVFLSHRNWLSYTNDNYTCSWPSSGFGYTFSVGLRTGELPKSKTQITPTIVKVLISAETEIRGQALVAELTNKSDISSDTYSGHESDGETVQNSSRFSPPISQNNNQSQDGPNRPLRVNAGVPAQRLSPQISPPKKRRLNAGPPPPTATFVPDMDLPAPDLFADNTSTAEILSPLINLGDTPPSGIVESRLDSPALPPTASEHAYSPPSGRCLLQETSSALSGVCCAVSWLIPLCTLDGYYVILNR